MNKLPFVIIGTVIGILFCYGLASIALKIDIEKAEPVLHFYGIGFALGAIATCIIIFAVFFINKQPSNNHQIKEGLNNG